MTEPQPQSQLRALVLSAGLASVWALILVLVVGILLSLASGQGHRPAYFAWFLSGILAGLALPWLRSAPQLRSVPPPAQGLLLTAALTLLIVLLVAVLSLMQPFGQPLASSFLSSGFGILLAAVLTAALTLNTAAPLADQATNRYRVEEALSRLIRGLGLLFFGVIVTVPLYLMVTGSLYGTPSGQGHDFARLANLSGGLKAAVDPFRAYYNLFVADASALASNFFGRYFLNSVWVSLATVIITLALSVPGAYAISRLQFPGQRLLSRSILLIYLVPVIVLVIPLFVMLTKLGLRNAWGLLLVYPATTLPVALYMLQGYFRGLPAELEEAGLMDGCARLRVIWSITIPLALPAIASVALYVFMIAWNEFLIAFMLLSDQSSFTLPIGINSMNSSEVATQDLMAAAVVATVPIVVLFLWTERFLVQGLTSGGVKG